MEGKEEKWMSQLTCYELMQRRFSGPSNDKLPSDAKAEM